MPKKITAILNDAEMTATVLASELQRISAGVAALRKGKLTDDTLVLLIQNAAPNVRKPGAHWAGNKGPISARTIRAVLDGMENLAKAYLKQPPEKTK